MMIAFWILPLPNEDFGMIDKRGNPDFEGSTVQGREYSIWATNHWKVYRKSGFHLLFILPKSSFGEHKFLMCLSNSHRDALNACQSCLKSVHACRCVCRTHNMMISFWNLPLPKEDFGRRNKRWNPDSRYTFQRFVAQIENPRPWTVLPSKSGLHVCSSFQNLRLGRIKFRGAFQGREYSILGD